MTQSHNFGDLEKVIRGRKHYEIIDFPINVYQSEENPEMKVAVRILSQKEVEESSLAADMVYRSKFPKEADYRAMPGYSKELERQLLVRCIVEVPTGENFVYTPFFPNAEIIGNILAVDQTTILMTHYTAVQEKYSPGATMMSDEDFRKIIDHCKKKSIRGLSLSTIELEILVDFLVKNPSILLKDNGLQSSPSKKSKQNGKKEPLKESVQKETKKSPRIQYKT